MDKSQELKVFEEYLSAKNLKHSEQRRGILGVFWEAGKHLTANELYSLTRKKYPGIGFATIYRALKLFCECGLCRELKTEEGIVRYERLYGNKHHDHLICTKCGRLVEVVDLKIEKLQEKLFQAHGFHPQRHRMELYGVCRKCRK